MSEKQASYIQQRCLPTYNTKLRIRCTTQSPNPIPLHPQSPVPSPHFLLWMFAPIEGAQLPSDQVQNGPLLKISSHNSRGWRATFVIVITTPPPHHPIQFRPPILNPFHSAPPSHTFLPVSSSTRGKPLSPPSFLSTLPQSAAVIHIVDVKYRLTITDQVVSSSTNKRST